MDNALIGILPNSREIKQTDPTQITDINKKTPLTLEGSSVINKVLEDKREFENSLFQQVQPGGTGGRGRGNSQSSRARRSDRSLRRIRKSAPGDGHSRRQSRQSNKNLLKSRRKRRQSLKKM